MVTLDDVYGLEKLISAIEKVNDQVTRQFKSLSLDDFFARPGEKWSASDTLRHLTKTVNAVARAMRVPKVILGMAFGKIDRPSRQYFEIRELYQKHIDMNAGAGKYAPAWQEIPATQAEAEMLRRRTIKQWRKTGKSLVQSLNIWTDSKLDKYHLPHPILGKLSIREMLFFTLYHNLHHVGSVRRRVQEMHARQVRSGQDRRRT